MLHLSELNAPSDRRSGRRIASDANLTLVTQTVIEDSIGLQMSEFISAAEDGTDLDATVSPNEPQWHRLQTRASPDLVRLGFIFDRGLHWVESGGTAAVTALRLRIRRKGKRALNGMMRRLFRSWAPPLEGELL